MGPLLAVALLFSQPPVAQPYKDDAVASAALGRTMKDRVLLPVDYATSGGQYRTLYLLHGLTGDYKDWSTRTDLARMAQSVPLIIVMPDGENAWYTNAADKGPRFEDYIADDLVKDVESKYRAIRSRYGRAIAGLSMGGLQRRGVKYQYHEVAGAHTWDYWSRRMRVVIPWLMDVFHAAE